MDSEGGTPQEQAVLWLENIHGELKQIRREINQQGMGTQPSFFGTILVAAVQGAVIAVVIGIILKSN